MGISYSNYIGPYVVCTRKTTKSVRKCTNAKGCKNKGVIYDDPEVKFCCMCGCQIDSVEVSIERTFDTYELRMSFDESLCIVAGEHFYEVGNQGTDIWISNRRCGGRSYHTEARDQWHLEVNTEMILGDITRFQEQFAKELSALVTAYGIENVVVKWGVIHYGA